MFITHQTRNGTIVLPLSQIASVWQAEGREDWEVEDVRGEKRRVSDLSWRIALETTPLTSFAAQPGTNLLALCDEGDGTFSLCRTAVLGWATYADGETRPVTLDVEATMGDYHVELPSGRVEASRGGATWVSVTAWRDDLSSTLLAAQAARE